MKNLIHLAPRIMNPLFFSVVASISTCGVYIYYFVFKWGPSPLPNSSDWGGFGSYVGGILSPIFTFITIYLMYGQLKQSTLIRKAELLKDNIARIDFGINEKLNSIFENNNYGEKLANRSIKSVILEAAYDIEFKSDDKFDSMALGLINHLSMMAGIVDEYLNICREIDGSNSKEMRNVEKVYWIQRYGNFCHSIFKLVGRDKIKKNLGDSYINIELFGCLEFFDQTEKIQH